MNNGLNFHRGHETEEHRADKLRTGVNLRRGGFEIVLYEERGSDVFASTGFGVSRRRLCVEIENSCKHVLPNLEKDFARGCDAVLILCPNFQVLGAVARRLSKYLPAEFREKVGLATVNTLDLVCPEGTSEPTASVNQEKNDEQSTASDQR
jgi:hypothetical protein